MLRTEEEAKQCWCPFVRHYNALHEPCGNSMAGMTADNMRRGDWPFGCIASACMAWRWGEGDKVRSKIELIKNRCLETHEGLKEAKAWTERPENIHLWSSAGRRGYCGLASKDS